MSRQLRKESLRERTEEYWRYLRDGLCDIECYIEELLGRELTYAEAHDTDEKTKRLRRLNQPVYTLALTVGESFEPLLQIICVLKPRRIILILNRRYGSTAGRNYGETLRRMVQKLQDAPDLSTDYRPDVATLQFDPVELKHDTPTEVFRKLRDAFQKREALAPDGYVNAVDITGAKKSMVVGAFLYAAHSGLPITYVDFDEFAKEFSKPYGYTCKIGQIADPYTLFRLRDWEQVRQLYNRYDFRGAKEILGKAKTHHGQGNGILGAMSIHLEGGQAGTSLYEVTDIGKVEQLVHAFEMYEAWDSGNFREAVNFSSIIPSENLPGVISKLGPEWFTVSATEITGGPPDFYENQQKLFIYSFDELARIERIIIHSQDYRSAFLRAGGLNELIMIARLVQLVTDLNIRSELLCAMQTRTPNAQSLFEKLTNTTVGESFSLREIGLKDAPRASVRINTEMRKWWQHTIHFADLDGWKRLIDLRNNLTHRYMSVPLTLAQDAYRFVKANFEDFWGQPIEEVGLVAKTVKWEQLCMLYQLDFLPPKLLD